MTEAEVRRTAVAFPDVNVRQMLHIIEGAAEEAAAGLTATRVVCAWRVVTDRKPGGDWLITAVAMLAAPPYPVSPPNEVLVVVMSIATEAGVPQAAIVDDMKFDPNTGELRLAWVETQLQERVA